MKRSISIVLIMFTLNGYSQHDVKAMLDSVLLRTEQTSMYISTINWDSVKKAVYQKAEHAKSIQDLKPAFEALLNGLRDHHGKIINAKDYSYLAWFSDFKNKRHPDKRTFDKEVWKIVNDTALKFEYQLLDGNIGYLKIVGIGPNVDIEAESRKIRDAVIELDNKKADKWIVDLRYNAGGNMHPMMAGIAPLIGNGLVGSLVNLNKEKLFDWEIKESNFIYGGYQAVTLPGKPDFKMRPKIAVLTSRWTASSGELVATTLKGRPDTRFFGEATGGYTTNDGWDIISNEVILVISTGVYCDREGNSYEINLPVDEEFVFKVNPEKDKDDCILAAGKWLMERN